MHNIAADWLPADLTGGRESAAPRIRKSLAASVSPLPMRRRREGCGLTEKKGVGAMSKGIFLSRGAARASLLRGASAAALLCYGSSALALEPAPAPEISPAPSSGSPLALPIFDVGRNSPSSILPSSSAPPSSPALTSSAAPPAFGYSGGGLFDPAGNPAPNPVTSATPEGIRILGGPAQASS